MGRSVMMSMKLETSAPMSPRKFVTRNLQLLPIMLMIKGVPLFRIKSAWIQPGKCFDKHLGTHPKEITVTECKIEYNCPEPKPKPGYGNNSDHEMDSLVDEIY